MLSSRTTVSTRVLMVATMVEQNSPECQEKSEATLDSKGFFKRVCLALGTESPTEIGRRIGLSKSAIGLWKKGNMPGGATIKGVVSVANVANVSLDWLMTGKRYEPTIQTKLQNAERAGAFLMNNYFKPEVAAALKQWAGNNGEMVCALVCLLAEKALAIQPPSRTIAEIAADYLAPTSKEEKRKAETPVVPDDVAQADADQGQDNQNEPGAEGLATNRSD